MTSKNTDLFSLLQEALMQVIEKTGQKQDWGFDADNNQGLVLDIMYELNKGLDELRLLKMETTEQGLVIHATIGPAITSWAEVRGAVYRLLGLVAEQMLVVAQKHDQTVLQFWFVTGNLVGHAPHGHIGRITTPMEDLKHLDPDEEE